MKAIIYKKYGPPEVMQLAEIAKPIPKDNEVCVKVMATAVTNSDIFIRSSKVSPRVWLPFRLAMGLFRPRKFILGEVLAGEIESVGKDVKRFKPGDKVYGFTGFGIGAYAQYKCMKEKDSVYGCLAQKPANISFEEATVVVYGGLLALQFMEKGNIQPGHKVLIYGASGTTGTMAVQLAKYMGAEVTGVCSTANLELVKSLGADKVIDYTKQDSIDTGEQYDFILDAVGKAKTSKLKQSCRKALTPGGKYASIDDETLKLDSNRLDKITKITEAGHIKPVIDKTYPLEQMMEAHRYVETGHKKGGVAITVGH